MPWMLLNAPWPMYFHSCQADGWRGRSLHCSGALNVAQQPDCLDFNYKNFAHLSFQQKAFSVRTAWILSLISVVLDEKYLEANDGSCP